MGVYNNSDWLLNQIRGTANVVIKAFKFETLDIDWGQVGDDQGQTVDGNVYIDDLLIQEKYDQVTAFIHSQLKRLTTIDYTPCQHPYWVFGEFITCNKVEASFWQ